MKKIKVDLAAGIVTPIYMVGDFFLLKQSATDINVHIPNININTEFSLGMSLKLNREFKEVQLLSDVTQIIEIVISSGDVRDNAVVGEVSIKSVSNTITSKVGINSTATKVFSANSARKAWGVQNRSAVDVYVSSDSLVSIDAGVLIKAGDFFVNDISAAGDLYAVTDTAVINNIHFIESY